LSCIRRGADGVRTFAPGPRPARSFGIRCSGPIEPGPPRGAHARWIGQRRADEHAAGPHAPIAVRLRTPRPRPHTPRSLRRRRVRARSSPVQACARTRSRRTRGPMSRFASSHSACRQAGRKSIPRGHARARPARRQTRACDVITPTKPKTCRGRVRSLPRSPTTLASCGFRAAAAVFDRNRAALQRVGERPSTPNRCPTAPHATQRGRRARARSDNHPPPGQTRRFVELKADMRSTSGSGPAAFVEL